MPKYDFYISPAAMNAAGTLGFVPDLHGPLDLEMFGAFVTNPISLEARSPAHGPRCLPYPGGFLLHTGYPNPGLRQALRQFAGRWERSPLPVIISLLPQTAQEVAWMVECVENLPGVLGVEIGLPPAVDASEAAAMASAAQGEMPLIVRLPLERAVELGPAVAGAAAAVSLGPPRGLLARPDGGLVRGRLYGPGIFPLALSAVQTLAGKGSFNALPLPVIAAGGIYSPADGEAMLSAGAIAIQWDTALWRGF